MMFTAVAALSIQPAQAYTVTLEEVGSNVLATGSGAINLTGLSFVGVAVRLSFIRANIGAIFTGQATLFDHFDEYTGFTGPTSFGSGGAFLANASSGGLCRN
jgi:hypothetical protein